MNSATRNVTVTVTVGVGVGVGVKMGEHRRNEVNPSVDDFSSSDRSGSDGHCNLKIWLRPQLMSMHQRCCDSVCLFECLGNRNVLTVDTTNRRLVLIS